MYNSLITSQAVQPANQIPFKDNEVLKVLSERKYSMIFWSHTDPYYRVGMHF